MLTDEQRHRLNVVSAGESFQALVDLVESMAHDAWEQGYKACTHDVQSSGEGIPNPYEKRN